MTAPASPGAKPAPVDRRRARGERTRTLVLDAAVAAASTEGLDGLTLGRLAAGLGVSKSGLFTHWPDKESLQLAAVAHASEQWTERVIRPAFTAPKGVRRLYALHLSRLAFYAEHVLPGGCFFTTVNHEFDNRPGPVREAVAANLGAWMGLLATLAREAVDRGELRPGTDPAQLAFEVDVLGEGAVVHTNLFGPGTAAAEHARRAVLQRLRALATDPDLLPPDLPPEDTA